MSIVLNRKYVEDPLNPTLEVVAFCLKQHQLQLTRLNKLFDYYNGKQEIEGYKHEDGTESKGLVVNHFKLVTDMFTSLALGNPVSYSDNAGQDLTNFNDVLDIIDIKSHDVELEKDLSVFGYSNELHYLKRIGDTTETEIQITKIDPRGSFVVTDDSVDKEKLFAVRYVAQEDLEGKQTGYVVEIYTAKEIIVYECEKISLEKATEIERKEHFFGGVPMVEFRNNEEKKGDAEPALSIFDEYNIQQSNRANDINSQIHAIMVTHGYSIIDQLTEAGNGHQVIIEDRNGDGTTEFIHNPLDQTQIEIFIKSLEENIHKITYCPNMNDEKFSGNVSGEAMKYKLFMMLNALIMKHRYFMKGIKERLVLLQNAINVKYGSSLDLNGVDIKLKPNLPVNLSEIISNINNSQEFIPLIHSLGWLPEVDNPEELINELDKQKEKNIRTNQKAMGFSHSDVEVVEDDNYKEDE